MLQKKKLITFLAILLLPGNLAQASNNNNNNQSSNSNNPNPLKRKKEPEENKDIKKQKLSEKEIKEEQTKFADIVKLMDQFKNNTQPLPSQNEIIDKIKLLKDINMLETKYATLNSLAHFAAFSKTNYVLNHLLDSNANVELKNANRDTPLMSAIISSNFDAIPILLKHKQNLNFHNKFNLSPLTGAMSQLIKAQNDDKQKWIDIIKILLQNGADPTLKNNKGISASEFLAVASTPHNLSNELLNQVNELLNKAQEEIEMQEHIQKSIEISKQFSTGSKQ